jgi:hypothetical protein
LLAQRDCQPHLQPTRRCCALSSIYFDRPNLRRSRSLKPNSTVGTKSLVQRQSWEPQPFAHPQAGGWLSGFDCAKTKQARKSTPLPSPIPPAAERLGSSFLPDGYCPSPVELYRGVGVTSRPRFRIRGSASRVRVHLLIITFLSGPEIRNPKLEIRNKLRIPMT